MDRLPGFRDFLPEPLPAKEVWSADLKQYIFSTWRRVAEQYGFREYDGPCLESLDLYTTKSGEEIVGQLFHFPLKDKEQTSVALRAEMTPTLARLVAKHHKQYKKPLKWFSFPVLFRYERQQKGRYREHFQFNADILGEPDSAADAELIALLIDTLRAFGLTDQDFVVRLSSRQAWHNFFLSQGGTEDREYAFFQIIDKLERVPVEVSRNALKEIGFNLDVIQEFIETTPSNPELEAILNNLEARGLRQYARLDYRVIRGLAYYTGPVFEAFDTRGELRAIAGGGRYDHLVGLMSGGKETLPALGFGMGDAVLAFLLEQRQKIPAFNSQVDVFFLIEDEAFRPASLRWIQALREKGLRVDYSLTSLAPGKQFKKALESGSTFTLRLEDTGENPPAVLKRLATREETKGPIRNLVDQVS